MEMEDEREDGDTPPDMDAAASFRKTLMNEVGRRASQGDALCGSLLDIMRIGEPFMVAWEYDEDTSDIDDTW